MLSVVLRLVVATTSRIKVKEEPYIEFIQENLIEFQV